MTALPVAEGCPVSLRRTVEPVEEPITVGDVKKHLRIFHDDLDDQVTLLLPSARDQIEQLTGRAFITQTWAVAYDGWPGEDRLVLPFPPIQSFTSLVYTDSAGVAAIASATTLYAVDTAAQPAVLYLRYGQSWPTVTLAPRGGIVATFVAGYGDQPESVPSWAGLTMAVLIGYWLEHPDSLTMDLPESVRQLCWPHRVRW